MFSYKCETFALHVANAWMAELFSKWQAQLHVKKTRKFLWFGLVTVASRALKYDVINFCQQAILFKSWYALNDPYLHNTLSILRVAISATRGKRPNRQQ